MLLLPERGSINLPSTTPNVLLCIGIIYEIGIKITAIYCIQRENNVYFGQKVTFQSPLSSIHSYLAIFQYFYFLESEIT